MSSGDSRLPRLRPSKNRFLKWLALYRAGGLSLPARQEQHRTACARTLPRSQRPLFSRPAWILLRLSIVLHFVSPGTCFPKPARSDVRKVMNLLETRYPNGNATEWHKTRNYLYSQKLLMVSQVRSVIDFLDGEKLPTESIIQSSPRILRSNVSTKLQPTYDFLVSLFGETTPMALQRNPDLLLTSKIGYQTRDNLGLIEMCLRNELQWSDETIETLRSKHPALFQQSVSRFLGLVQSLRVEFNVSDSLISKLLLKQPTLFQLSLDALKERLNATGSTSHRQFFEPANAGVLCQSAESIRQKVSIVGPLASAKHPPILGLSVENLRSKSQLFQRLHPNLATTVTNKCPSVMSLSIEAIQVKVSFLRETVWRNSTNETGIQLNSSPTCLSISLEKNLRPTVEFFRSTHYWNSSLITGRHLAASLYGRLLPRYHFNPRATLSQLVFDSDENFCGGKYLAFKNCGGAKNAIDQARWKLWLETGLPMTDS